VFAEELKRDNLNTVYKFFWCALYDKHNLKLIQIKMEKER